MATLVLTSLLVQRQQETEFSGGDELMVVVTPDSGPEQTRTASGLRSNTPMPLGITVNFSNSVGVRVIEEDTPPIDQHETLLDTLITTDRGNGPVSIDFTGPRDEMPAFGQGSYRLIGLLSNIRVPDPPIEDPPPISGTEHLHVLVDNPLQVLGLVEGFASLNSVLSSGVVGELEDLGDSVATAGRVLADALEKIENGLEGLAGSAGAGEAAKEISDALEPLRDIATKLDDLGRIERALEPLRDIATKLDGLGGSGLSDVAARLEGLSYINATLGSIDSTLAELNDITAALGPLAGLPAALGDLAGAVAPLAGLPATLGDLATAVAGIEGAIDGVGARLGGLGSGLGVLDGAGNGSTVPGGTPTPGGGGIP